MIYPFICFICGSDQHDCGHRETELLIHCGLPVPPREPFAWAKHPQNYAVKPWYPSYRHRSGLDWSQRSKQVAAERVARRESQGREA